jgi:hypothetical protein
LRTGTEERWAHLSREDVEGKQADSRILILALTLRAHDGKVEITKKKRMGTPSLLHCLTIDCRYIVPCLETLLT